MSDPRQTLAATSVAAVPRPMQQRVHIVIQVDWFQIAEKFLPRPDETPDVRGLTIAVMNRDEQLNCYIDMIKQMITNHVWARFGQYLRKREFCLKMVRPHNAQIVSLSWDDTWRESLTAQSIPHNIGLLQLVVYPSLDYTFHPRTMAQIQHAASNP